MDNLTILDDILNCGFTAPRLADMANANHLSIVAIANQVQEILKKKTHFAVFTSAATDRDDRGAGDETNRNFILRDTSFLDNVCKPLRMIQFQIKSGSKTGKFYVRSSNNTAPAKAFIDMRMSKFSELLELPEHCHLNALRLNTDFELPFFVAIDSLPYWEDMLRNLAAAPQIREGLLEFVKAICNNENSTPACDVFRTTQRRRDNKATIAEFASLFSSKRITKSMERAEVREALEAGPLNDLGIKNIDDLAVVITFASHAFDFDLFYGERSNLCNLEGYAQMRRSDFKESLRIRNIVVTDLKEEMCRFIEFCGGTVPSTICWRREKNNE